MQKAHKIILPMLLALFLVITLATPVLAYDGMGGIPAESSISLSTNQSFLIINTTTVSNTCMDIKTSTTTFQGHIPIVILFIALVLLGFILFERRVKI
jgi:hypothetical protein